MNKTLPMLVTAVVLLTGCEELLSPSERERIKINRWEYQVELPPETTPTQLAELEKRLKQDGYRQVVFRNRYSDTWTPVLVGRRVFATRKQDE